MTAKEHLNPKDCLSCGLCCMPLGYQDAFCNIDEDEIKRLDKNQRRHVMRSGIFDMLLASIDGGRGVSPAAITTRIREMKDGPFKGKEACTCYFLEGVPMKSVRCSVYKVRPSTCRVTCSAGDKTCRKIRKYWKAVLREQCGWKG